MVSNERSEDETPSLPSFCITFCASSYTNHHRGPSRETCRHSNISYNISYTTNTRSTNIPVLFARPDLSRCGNELRHLAVRLLHDLVGRSLDNTTGNRQLRANTSKERVDITSSHAAFLNPPDLIFVSRISGVHGRIYGVGQGMCRREGCVA